MAKKNYAKLSTLIRADPSLVYEAFVEPKTLSKYWLKRSSGRLESGIPVTWKFLVPGAFEITTAKKLVPGELVSFSWSDGVEVKIALEKHSRGSTIARVVAGPFSSTKKAVDATEGFCTVLCDLKLLLETNRSPGLVKDKAKLIAM